MAGKGHKLRHTTDNQIIMSNIEVDNSKTKLPLSKKTIYDPKRERECNSKISIKGGFKRDIFYYLSSSSTPSLSLLLLLLSY